MRPERTPWQERVARERRAAEKRRARRARQPRAKLIFPDGRWCYIRAFSHYDAELWAAHCGVICPEGTEFWDESKATDPEKEICRRGLI